MSSGEVRVISKGKYEFLSRFRKFFRLYGSPIENMLVLSHIKEVLSRVCPVEVVEATVM